MGESDAGGRDPEGTSGAPGDDGPSGGDPAAGRDAGEADRVYHLLVDAVDSILRQNPEARTAYERMCATGRPEKEAREEIARVLLAVTYHVGGESKRLKEAGGAAGLRAEAFRRLAAGETAAQIFGG